MRVLFSMEIRSALLCASCLRLCWGGGLGCRCGGCGCGWEGCACDWIVFVAVPVPLAVLVAVTYAAALAKALYLHDVKAGTLDGTENRC